MPPSHPISPRRTRSGTVIGKRARTPPRILKEISGNVTPTRSKRGRAAVTQSAGFGSVEDDSKVVEGDFEALEEISGNVTPVRSKRRRRAAVTQSSGHEFVEDDFEVGEDESELVEDDFELGEDDSELTEDDFEFEDNELQALIEQAETLDPAYIDPEYLEEEEEEEEEEEKKGEEDGEEQNDTRVLQSASPEAKHKKKEIKLRGESKRSLNLPAIEWDSVLKEYVTDNSEATARFESRFERIFERLYQKAQQISREELCTKFSDPSPLAISSWVALRGTFNSRREILRKLMAIIPNQVKIVLGTPEGHWSAEDLLNIGVFDNGDNTRIKLPGVYADVVTGTDSMTGFHLYVGSSRVWLSGRIQQHYSQIRLDRRRIAGNIDLDKLSKARHYTEARRDGRETNFVALGIFPGKAEPFHVCLLESIFMVFLCTFQQSYDGDLSFDLTTEVCPEGLRSPRYGGLNAAFPLRQGFNLRGAEGFDMGLSSSKKSQTKMREGAFWTVMHGVSSMYIAPRRRVLVLPKDLMLEHNVGKGSKIWVEFNINTTATTHRPEQHFHPKNLKDPAVSRGHQLEIRVKIDYDIKTKNSKHEFWLKQTSRSHSRIDPEDYVRDLEILTTREIKAGALDQITMYDEGYQGYQGKKLSGVGSFRREQYSAWIRFKHRKCSSQCRTSKAKFGDWGKYNPDWAYLDDGAMNLAQVLGIEPIGQQGVHKQLAPPQSIRRKQYAAWQLCRKDGSKQTQASVNKWGDWDHYDEEWAYVQDGATNLQQVLEYAEAEEPSAREPSPEL